MAALITRVLQDWTTIRGASSIAGINQGESEWLDTSQYQDVTFWLLLRDVTLGGGTALNLIYQTAPIKDDRLFVSLGSVSLASASLSVPTTTAIITTRFTSNTTVGLAAWLRWRLVPTGATSSWDATFRVIAAFNQTMSFPPRTDEQLRLGNPGGT